MKPAKDGPRDYPAEPLGRANQWRIFGQSEMWPNMVVGSISLEDGRRKAKVKVWKSQTGES